MKTIGFRAECDGINWAVAEGTTDHPALVASDYIPAPKSSTEASCLSYFRDRVLAVMRLHSPVRAFVRYPEAFGRGNKNITSNDARLRVEGVVVEALQTTNVELWTGTLRQFASCIGTDDPKDYLARDDIRGLRYPKKSKTARESVMAAVAALESDYVHASTDDASGSLGTG